MDIEKSVHQGDMEQEKQTAKQLRSNLELLQVSHTITFYRRNIFRVLIQKQLKCKLEALTVKVRKGRQGRK